MNPIRTFITRPVFTGMLTFVVVVFGLVSWPKIGVDLFPEIDFPMVTVTTVLPGADPEAIEKTVTEPLEEVLNTLPGLDTLHSVNVENVSQIMIRFDLARNIELAAQVFILHGLFQHGRMAYDDAQRGAQLVRSDGHKVRLLALQVFQLGISPLCLFEHERAQERDCRLRRESL